MDTQAKTRKNIIVKRLFNDGNYDKVHELYLSCDLYKTGSI